MCTKHKTNMTISLISFEPTCTLNLCLRKKKIFPKPLIVWTISAEYVRFNVSLYYCLLHNYDISCMVTVEIDKVNVIMLPWTCSKTYLSNINYTTVSFSFNTLPAALFYWSMTSSIVLINLNLFILYSIDFYTQLIFQNHLADIYMWYIYIYMWW